MKQSHQHEFVDQTIQNEKHVLKISPDISTEPKWASWVSVFTKEWMGINLYIYTYVRVEYIVFMFMLTIVM